ncbi:NACHT domain-containing protein [Nocardia salmonicida]
MTILANGPVSIQLPASTGGSAVPLDRQEYLHRLRQASRSRREFRRSGAGLTEQQVDRSQRVPVAVPDELVTGFGAGQMRALIGPLGSGKSDIAEQWHIDAIDLAGRHDAAPVPVWVSARSFTTSVEALVTGKLREESELESVGVDVVIDGLDENTPTAPEIIREAAEFVARWPKSRVVLTSRSQVGIPARCCIEVPPLSQAEADHLMRAVAGGPVGALNPELAAAVERPLFAVLVARHISEASGVTGIPELIDRVVDDIIEKVGYDCYEQLQQLAVETIKSGRPVDPERFTTPDVAARVRNSPMTTSSGRDCVFSLATFEQWFAAKALLHGAVPIEEVLVSLQTFDRWKYVLAIVLASGEPERADPVIAAVARWNPGALAWLIRESRAGGLARHRPAFGPEDWEPIGHRLRTAATAMLEGLGPLAQATYPIKIGGTPDLSGITIAVEAREASFTLAWLISDEDPTDPLDAVVPLPLRSTNRSIYLRRERLTTGMNWVWEVMQRHLAQGIGGSLESTVQRLALQVEGVARAERIEASRQQAIGWPSTNASPTDAVAPLYPAPDRAPTYTNPWGSYSEERMQQRVEQVIAAALLCYRELCENLTPRFGDTLGHHALMPVQFYGDISYHSDQKKEAFDYPEPHEPGLIWTLKPIGTTTQDGRRRGSDSVNVTINDNHRAKEIRYDRKVLDHSYVQYFESLPALEPYIPAFSIHVGSFDILSDQPATALALQWLREDLKRFGWIPS